MMLIFFFIIAQTSQNISAILTTLHSFSAYPLVISVNICGVYVVSWWKKCFPSKNLRMHHNASPWCIFKKHQEEGAGEGGGVGTLHTNPAYSLIKFAYSVKQFWEGWMTTGILSSHFKKKKTINSWRFHALCNSVLSCVRNHWGFKQVIRNSMGNEIWSIYNDKFLEIWTFYT